jgi:hypothetical protein
MNVRKFARMFFISMALLVLLFAVGCVKLPPPDASNPIAKVAVLPLQNSTNDLDAPNWVRVAFSNIVPSRYYQLIPADQVDQVLREKMNITLAGQLDYMNPGAGAPSPQDVGKTLEVDGLFYCNLEDFQNLITGFYNKRKVKAKCKLVNAKTADVVWEREEEESNSELNLSVAGAIGAVKQKVVGAVLDKAFRHNPLEPQTNVVVYKMQQTIPSGPVASAAK